MRTILATAIVCAMTATAAAQPSEAPVAKKSPSKAFALSAAGTAAGVGMVVGGLALNPNERPAVGWGVFLAGVAVTTVGPSLGHFYADDPWTTGFAIRAGGAVTFATGTILMLRGFHDNEHCRQSDSCDFTLAAVGGGTAAVGLLAIGAGAALDIATAPRAATRWNERRGVTLSIAPTLVSGRDRAVGGLAVAGTF